MTQPLTDITHTTSPLTLEKSGDGTYRLSRANEGQGVALAITLSEGQVRTLALAALHLLPDITPKYAVPDEQEIYRLPARKLIQLDDHSLQVWVREMKVVTLINFLWFMNDEALAEKIIRNMSVVAGRMLVDDLNTQYQDLDPDTAPTAYVTPARQAAIEAVEIFERLRREGKVIDL